MNLRQQQALSLLNAGLSIVPIRPDGTKAATVKWERYQAERATEQEVMRWFASMHSGIGIIGGVISGGLEILDFDDAEVFEPWMNLVNQVYEGIIDHMPIIQTPTGGSHIYYRAYHVEGNQKLARRRTADGKMDVRIETRGEGGYVVSPYSHPDCHDLRKTYQLIRSAIETIPLISHQAREVLLNCARAFDEVVDPPKRQITPQADAATDRPGDVFAATHSWEEILAPAGWKSCGHHGETVYWKRPDKRDKGWSATTNHDGRDLLYVFSSNAWPFKEHTGYSKFTCFTLLNYRGDFHAAAKALVRR